MKKPLIPLFVLSLLVLAGCSSDDKPPTTAASGTTFTPSSTSELASGSVGGAAARSAPNAQSGQPGQPAGPAPEPDPDAWPRALKSGTTTYTIYQPQLDAWDGFKIECRAAVSVLPDGGKEPTYGIIYLSGQTKVDREERMVEFEKLDVTKTQFPSLQDSSPYLSEFQSFIPKDIKAISLDRLEASLAILQARAATPVTLRNEPPAFVFATKPTLLVSIDGQPHFAPIGDAGIQRVVNTRVLLLKDIFGIFYLKIYDGYLSAETINGPWNIANSVPDGVRAAQEMLVAAKQVDLLAGQPDPETQKQPTLQDPGPPAIRVVTMPTELILTEGEPKWVPIPATQLLYIENTPAHVFKDLTDQQTYVLMSGRWFSAPRDVGPWTYVPGKSLPADFANIPDTSPKENVKASIPNTRQAQEAVIANSIPTTTKMDRKTAKMNPDPTYDGGTPQLKPVENTSLFYAINSATPVIQVEVNSWYACQNGVWFAAVSPTGPWVIADTVPAVIYTIPTSSPLHYVTYCRVYQADADFIWVGYTPGYYGTLVSADGTIVYGTGYVYAPYVSDAEYIAYYTTYGYSANAAWSPWTGWAFGFSIGYCWGSSWGYWGCCPPAPYWGPYWGYCYGWGYNAAGGITAWGPYGWAGTSGNIYSQNGPWSGVSRVAAGENAWTGNRWASQYGRAYNSTTGTRAIGSRGAIENVYTGDYAYGRRGAAYNDRTGNAAWGSKTTIGNEYTGNEATVRRGGVYNEATGDTTRYGSIRGDDGGVARIGDDVYAGKDGNVYKKTDGGWEQMTGNRPTPTDRSGTGATAGTSDLNRSLSGSGSASHNYSNLNSEYNARHMGSQRSYSNHMSRGGFRGGGGFRR